MFQLVVLSCIMTLAAAKPGLVTPVSYATVAPAVSSVSQYSSSVVHPSAVAVAPAIYSAAVVPAVAPAVYHCVTLSQAPHSPAVVLDPVHGVPLDTPEVISARAAHYQVKALSELHHLRKCSISITAPVAYSSVVSPVDPVAYSSSIVSPLSYSTSVDSSPVVSSPVASYSAPLVTSPYSSVIPRAPSVNHW